MRWLLLGIEMVIHICFVNIIIELKPTKGPTLIKYFLWEVNYIRYDENTIVSYYLQVWCMLVEETKQELNQHIVAKRIIIVQSANNLDIIINNINSHMYSYV